MFHKGIEARNAARAHVGKRAAHLADDPLRPVTAYSAYISAAAFRTSNFMGKAGDEALAFAANAALRWIDLS